MYQPPNAWVGEVTRTFFNVSRLDKSCQYFKIVNEKNNMTFHISEQFKNFQSLKEKISYKTEYFVKLWIWDLRSISAAQGRPKRIGNSVKKPDIMNYVYMLAYVLKSSSHMEKEQDKPHK